APGLARREFDQGAAPADLPMERMLLVLKRSPEQQTSLSKLLDDQQDPSSASYHKWLTPEQFGQQFGASNQDIQSITAWLQSHGLQVNQVTKGRTVIEFSGTAAQVQDAFHTQMRKFVVDGESFWANAGNLQIPSALVPAIAGPWSLHSFRKKPQLSSTKQKFEALYKPGARPEFTGSNGAHALFPGDYSVIYNINPVYQNGINGTGTSIAIVARTNIDFTDPSEFWSISGVNDSSTIIDSNGPDPGLGSADDQFEAVLDVSWAGAIAPVALRHFVVSGSTNSTDGVDLSELYIVEHNLADVMTESFGSCEGFFTQQEADGIASLAEQAASQGITYIVSTGDSGASTCDRPSQSLATHPISVNILAATPFNIAAGGTMFNENGQNSTFWNTTNTSNLASAKTYIRENVWNESCSTAQCGSNANLSATGGGVSTFFSKPSWQTGVTGIPADGHRDIPDISLTAAGHDPYLLCFQRSCEPDAQNLIHFFGVSGTSASAPSFAGIMALIVQKTGSRQGQANYVLYKLAAAQNYSQCNGSSTAGAPAAACTFHDITVGNNAVPGQTSQQYQSTVGYDPATGLGSPNVANLV
ncbi:MAG TPA: S53 family peptidase, partial [Terriglobales bacterium]|nr:S53 family peptidase [Terriglobales bacterium]